MVDIEREIGDKDVRVTVKDLHLADPKLFDAHAPADEVGER